MRGRDMQAAAEGGRGAEGGVSALEAPERRLVARYQSGLPLAPAPFSEMGRAVGLSEAQVLEALVRLRERGVLSRVGAVVRPHTVGASTLAAMAVPEAELERVAAQVSARPEVNHNYEREGELNLWFVVTAADEAHLARVLAEIEQACGHEVIALPMEREYHIDLGFDLEWTR
ncbi:Lrp/AsnC family transcriptional regulator [Inmirania thermothiophila]|uniref:siroheme decarboxylase n=1 Tax=Inmirania thermothiophila TaxID=1750597 RepID=A0A3N1XTM5_9GAMM|nr:Lrp/AsnC family transcriptional regulator [Inmirania thermothiophila]ROR29521.1 AsnC family transcriptional regulator [Inmirania thermothiophila]